MVRHIAAFFLLALTSFVFSVQAQNTNISGILNTYTGVTAFDLCNNTVDVASVTGFSPSEKVLIIQMKGASINSSNSSSFGTINSYNDAGNYEFALIAAISGNTISFVNALQRNYDPAHDVQLVKVAEFTSATITGTLTSTDWNGTTGGVLVVECSDSLIFNAPIDLSGKGFRGGTDYQSNYNCTWLAASPNFYYSLSASPGRGAWKGEGIAEFITGRELGKGPQASGGGGGNDHNAGGGGGGNAGVGGLGGQRTMATTFECKGVHPGQGGRSLIYNNSNNKIFLGGGGGAGHRNNNFASAGADGGGIVIIKANTIVSNGSGIVSTGLQPDTTAGDGAAGGGAGGAVLLDVSNYTTPLNINVGGGNGGYVYNDPGQCMPPGGGGGGGMVWVNQVTPPIMLNISYPGGPAGTVYNNNADPGCQGSTNGATAGIQGMSLGNLQIPEGTSPFVSIAQASPDTSICPGQGVQLWASGGTTYSWNPSSGLSCTNCSNPTATPSSNTQYIVTVDNGTCIGYDTVNVTVLGSGFADAGNDTTVCYGSQVQLSGSGGGTYSWIPVLGLSCINCPNPTLFAQSTTDYILAVQNGGCADKDTVTVFVAGVPTAVVSPDTTICAGSTIKLLASGGTSYAWSPTTGLAPANVAMPMANPTVTTTYSVVVSNGCGSDTGQVTVTVIPHIPISISSDTTICSGSSSTLWASGGTAFNWSPTTGLSCSVCPTTQANPTVTTTYSVTVTDQIGCTGIDSTTITVTPGPTPSIIASATQICVGDTVDFLASGGTDYSWVPNYNISDVTINKPNAYPDTTTTYVVTVTDSVGCSATADHTVTVFPNPAPPVIQNNGNMLFVTQGFSFFQWYLNGDTIVGATDYFFNTQQDGNYSISVMDANGCEAYSETFTHTMIGVVDPVLQNISLFPNPSNGSFILLHLGIQTEIEIWNSVGQMQSHKGNLPDQVRQSGFQIQLQGFISSELQEMARLL